MKTTKQAPKSVALAKLETPAAMQVLSASSKLLSAGLENVAKMLEQNPTPAAVCHVKAQLDEWTKMIDEVKTAAKDHLKAYVEAHGEDTGNGKRKEFKVGGRAVVAEVQVQRHKIPDETKIRALLLKKKLTEEDAFTQEVNTVLDVDKLALLVEQGKLTEEEVDACRMEKARALKVTV